MTDENNADPAATGTTPEQVFEINRIYLKDLSFESPTTPALFIEPTNWRPEINVQLNAESQPQPGDLFEVILSITVTATQEGRTVWLAEVKQAGLFRITGFEAPALGQMLGSFCPATLFPFAREVVADIVGKGGLPSFYLAPINFDALYSQHVDKLRGSAPAPETAQ